MFEQPSSFEPKTKTLAPKQDSAGNLRDTNAMQLGRDGAGPTISLNGCGKVHPFSCVMSQSMSITANKKLRKETEELGFGCKICILCYFSVSDRQNSVEQLTITVQTVAAQIVLHTSTVYLHLESEANLVSNHFLTHLSIQRSSMVWVSKGKGRIELERIPSLVEHSPDVVDMTSGVVRVVLRVIEVTPDVVDDSPNVVDMTSGMVGMSPGVVEVTPSMVELTPGVVGITPDVVAVTSSVFEVTISMVEMAPSVVEVIPSVVGVTISGIP